MIPVVFFSWAVRQEFHNFLGHDSKLAAKLLRRLRANPGVLRAIESMIEASGPER